MKVIIDIPQEFIKHYENDKFIDSLSRVLHDAFGDKNYVEDGLSGLYEKETLEMLIEAFKVSKQDDEMVRNCDKYKTPKELEKALHKFCDSEHCLECKYHKEDSRNDNNSMLDIAMNDLQRLIDNYSKLEIALDKACKELEEESCCGYFNATELCNMPFTCSKCWKEYLLKES